MDVFVPFDDIGAVGADYCSFRKMDALPVPLLCHVLCSAEKIIIRLVLFQKRRNKNVSLFFLLKVIGYEHKIKTISIFAIEILL